MIINGKDIFEEQFINKLLDYEQWVSKAYQLIDAAKALENKMKETWKDWGKYSNSNQGYLLIDDRYLSTFFMLPSFAGSSYASQNLNVKNVISPRSANHTLVPNNRLKLTARLFLAERPQLKRSVSQTGERFDAPNSGRDNRVFLPRG